MQTRLMLYRVLFALGFTLSLCAVAQTKPKLPKWENVAVSHWILNKPVETVESVSVMEFGESVVVIWKMTCTRNTESTRSIMIRSNDASVRASGCKGETFRSSYQLMLAVLKEHVSKVETPTEVLSLISQLPNWTLNEEKGAEP